MIWVVLGLLLLVAVGWYLFRPASLDVERRKEEEARSERIRKRLVRTPADMEGLGDVRALTLTVPDLTKACIAARKANGEDYLTHEAPPLPLPECDRAECSCAYYAVPGRRSGRDRRSGEDRRKSLRFEPDKPDRRSGQDRRRGGKDPWTGRS